MSKTWVIAEQLKASVFSILKVIRSAGEPTEECRTTVIETFESYQRQGVKIPNTIVCLFAVCDEEAGNQLSNAGPDKVATVFEKVKSAGNTRCCEIVSIQRSAWCHTKGIDILEYSLQNGGGDGKKRLEIVVNEEFQAFRREQCEME